VNTLINIFDFETVHTALNSLLLSISTWPPSVTLGLALMLGALAGEVAHRLHIARVYGYWLAGAASASAFALMMPSEAQTSAPLMQRFAWVFDIALGWLLVEAGRRLDVQWLLRNPALAVTAVLEWVLAAAGVSAALMVMAVPWPHALLAGVVLAHASPVLVHAISASLRSEGQVSERAMHLSATGIVLTAVAMPVALTMAQTHAQAAAVSAGVVAPLSVLSMAQPLTDALAALAVGALLGALVRWISEPSGHLSALRAAPPDMSTKALVGVAADKKASARKRRARGTFMLRGPTLAGGVCLMVGLAQWWGLPALLGCVALGWAARSRRYSSHSEPDDRMLSSVGTLALVLVFMVAGAALPWNAWWQNGLSDEVFIAAAGMLFARFVMKLIAIALTGNWSGLRLKQSLALALALQPTSVTGAVFWMAALTAFAAWNPLAAQAVALALLLGDVLMPALLSWLLRTIGEAGEPQIELMQTTNSARTRVIDTELAGATRI
jgi:Sodium/hydrogen exchanger family